MKLQKNATDMTGRVIGSLTVIEPTRRESRGIFWRCQCACGNDTYEATTGDLNSGRIKSCGCYRGSEAFALTKVTHGQRRQRKGTTTRTYNIWLEMKRRCDDPSRDNYRWYGGKGITYAPEWGQFQNFYAHMGDCPPGMEIDRINNEGNYEPGNCRWVTHQENCQNRGGKFAQKSD